MTEETTKKDKATEDDAKKAKDNREQTPPPETVEPEENPFDFGGLPKRDLKKNLGCG